MIVIGPGALLLLILLMFKPVRFLVGWALCAVMLTALAFVIFAISQHGG